MPTSDVTITTNDASRLIKRLCKHFRHKVETNYNDHRGTVDFPGASCIMTAHKTALHVEITADDNKSREQIEHVISSHADQFARDESFDWNWQH